MSVCVVCWIFLQTYYCIQAKMWTLIRLLLEEQFDLGPHCLHKWLLKSQADNKADDNCCDWSLMVNTFLFLHQDIYVNYGCFESHVLVEKLEKYP